MTPRLSTICAVAAAMLVAIASTASADVCVWRDPERTMSKLFPAAKDYKTVTKKIKKETAQKIEALAGVRLDETERAEFNYYDITGTVGSKTQKVGTVLALAGAGDYGAIEVVIGLDNDEKIVGAYIQRMRERSGDKLRSEEFLGQFKSKTVKDPIAIGNDIKPVSEAKTASQAITVAIKKMLAFYEVLH